MCHKALIPSAGPWDSVADEWSEEYNAYARVDVGGGCGAMDQTYRHLLEVARILTEADVGLLVVGEDNRRVLGVVSERDVVRPVARGASTGNCR